MDQVQGRPRRQIEAIPGPHNVYGSLTTAPNSNHAYSGEHCWLVIPQRAAVPPSRPARAYLPITEHAAFSFFMRLRAMKKSIPYRRTQEGGSFTGAQSSRKNYL
jgi:hypothetical protein